MFWQAPSSLQCGMGDFVFGYCFCHLARMQLMSTRVQLLWMIMLALLLAACNKENPQPEQPRFDALRVPQSFNWSSISNLIINVTVNSGHNGMVLDLRDVEGRRIDRAVIANDRARFNVRLGTELRDVVIHCPMNGQDLLLPAFNASEFMALSSVAAANWNAAADTDGDSIPDPWDDYPSDPQKAFLVQIPYVGEHYVLFDDSWPVKGDYDFNDVVLSNRMQLQYDARKRLLKGDVQVKLLAYSAEQDWGIGMELFSSVAGSTYAYPFGPAAFFSGVSRDDSVDNCAIITPNARNLQRVAYRNDGVGLTARPDGVNFSFTWDATIGGDHLWPNFFIFPALERSRELHAFGYPPTIAAEMSHFSTVDDASISRWSWLGSFAMPNAFYRSFRNLPWGVEFFHSDFRIPRAGVDLATAYPLLTNWAEQAGGTNLSWRDFPNNQQVVQVPQ